jgi:flagellar biosynthesis protein FlhA
MATDSPPISLLNSINFNAIAKRTDLIFALAFISIMTILIMPMPKFVLDMFLSLSMTFSILILMTGLFIQKPLEFSSFPTVLLIATMVRLALNVASTRLILSNGQEGTAAAGRVIEAFGHFVMGGNFVIGVIIFAILIIINFIVITKGSSRIAEVSARFSLDAMPGKQMAIDADLSAGLIDEEEAKRRRKEIEAESNFFGAMDGAAKFVRGDAIAALLITFINVIAGIVIGMVQKGMTFDDASHTFLILSVGDGLVSQVPALIVSTAAGMMVSKAGVEGTMDKALFSQLSAYPSALGMSSFLMGTLGIMPGIPFFPFALLSGLTGIAAYYANQEHAKRAADATKILEEKEAKKAKDAAPKDAEKSTDLNVSQQVDAIRLELGYALLGLLNSDGVNKSLSEQIKVLRQQMVNDMGIILPSVRIQDNLELPPNHYSIKIKEMEAGKGTLKPGQYMVMDPMGQKIALPGEETIEPSFGLQAMWVGESQKKQAELLNYTVVDPTMVLATHISEIVKDNISDLLSYADVQYMLDKMSDSYKKLLNDIVPNYITVGGIQRILQNLVNERVSIRDLNTILEGIAEASTFTKNTINMTEHVRQRLSRQITFSNTDENGYLSIMSLSPEWENIFNDALMGDNEVKRLALAPSHVQEFMRKATDQYDRMSMMGEMPILVTSSQIRPYVRSFVERIKSSIIVLSQNEIHPKAKIRNVGSL